jgi:hypothetical protein
VISLRDSYMSVSPSVVAVVPRFRDSAEVVPQIIGTGFFVSAHGVVCTCRHVVDAFEDLPKPAGFSGIPANVLLFREAVVAGRSRWCWFELEIVASGDATFEGGQPAHIPQGEPPDASFLLVNARETPNLAFSPDLCAQGDFVAFAGFPMGTALLRAPAGFRQLSPSLHWGIVSAIFPNPSAETPYGFLVHANTQGGASGSPVFTSNGSVVGMVYMVLRDVFAYGRANESEQGVAYEVPTALTGCISGRLVHQAATKADAQAAGRDSRPRLAELFLRGTPVEATTGKPVLGSFSIL